MASVSSGGSPARRRERAWARRALVTLGMADRPYGTARVDRTAPRRPAVRRALQFLPYRAPVAYLKDQRVDAYIDALPAWQQAICRQVRDLLHETDPAVVETIKR